jgi:S-adenosylmethionine synthetase
MPERNIYIVEATSRAVDDIPVEMVERKGIGHPDTLCDNIAERVSREYMRWCEDNLHGALHHNFDKVTLVAGEVDVRFGGGDIIKPIHIYIAGRATPNAKDRLVPVDAIAIAAAKSHIRETMKNLDPDKHCIIECVSGRGAGELVSVVNQVTANDTSFGAAHWPRSVLENTVYETAQFINYELLKQLPVGEDIKVMGFRQRRDVTLTVSMPLLAAHVKDASQYDRIKAKARTAIQKRGQELATSYAVRVDLNTGDDPANSDFYLTLTGTSAEMGDDGVVGRGNRVTGFIAPFRPTSLEAAAGKNPISHVGKIYNLMGLLGAKEIVSKVPAIVEAQVYILSQIGKPLDQPLGAAVVVRTDGKGLTPDINARVTAVMDAQLQNVEGIRTQLKAGTLAVC